MKILKLFTLFLLLQFYSSKNVIVSRDQDELSRLIAHSRPPGINTLSNTFIIEVKIENASDKSRDLIKNQVLGHMQAFNKFMLQCPIQFSFIYAYFFVFQGFAIALENPSDMLRIEKAELEFIASIHSNDEVYLQQTDAPGKFPSTAMNMPILMQEHNLGSAGIKVALPDQGIPYTEPPFVKPSQQCVKLKDPGCRVIKVEGFSSSCKIWFCATNVVVAQTDCRHKHEGLQDFIQPRFAPVDLLQNPEAMPGYTEGQPVYGNHGTKVAGLLGGTSPLAPGIAQEVEFYDYRIFDSAGRTEKTHAYKAIDAAIIDDVDVISLAFGSPGGIFLGKSGPYRKTNRSQDILVVSAVGNYGYEKTHFYLTDLAEPSYFISTGAIRVPLRYFFTLNFKSRETSLETIFKFSQLGQKSTFENQLGKYREYAMVLQPNLRAQFIGRRPNPRNLPPTLVLVPCRNPENCLKALTPIDEKKVVPLGIIFFCDCSLAYSKLSKYKVPIGLTGEFTEFVDFMLSTTVSYLTMHRIINWDLERRLLPSQISSFGPTDDLRIKPDISAPGENVFVYKGAHNDPFLYEIDSGTSYSAAQVAGILSLLVWKYNHEGTPFNHETLLALIYNTARPMLMTPDEARAMKINIYGLAHPVMKQGAGLINMKAMLHSKLTVTPYKLELQEIVPSAKFTKYRMAELKIYNHEARDVELQIGHVPAISSIYRHFKSVYEYEPYAFEVIFRDESSNLINKIKVPRNSCKILFVIFKTAKEFPNYLFLSGYIQLFPIITSADGSVFPSGYLSGPVYVPYLGLYGNLEKFPSIVTYGKYAPFLSNLHVGAFSRICKKVPGPFPKYKDMKQGFPTFTLVGHSKPVVFMCLNLPAIAISFYLHDFTNAKVVQFLITYANSSVHCYIFLLSGCAIPYGKDFNMSRINLNDNGFDGFRRLFSSDVSHNPLLINGHYQICAKIRTKYNRRYYFDSTYDWCSIPFVIHIPDGVQAASA